MLAMAIGVSELGLCALADGPAAPAQPGAPAAGAKPAAKAVDESHVSEMIVKDVKEVPAYLHGSGKATIATFQESLKKTWEPLIAKAKAGGIVFTAVPIFVYHGATGQPDQEFSMETGFPVEAGTKDLDKDFTVSKLVAFHCATAYHSGPVKDLGKSYGELFGDIISADYKLTGETREVYLFWEGPESVNNVVEIQVGITK
jgi:effector-binding domain-containing protein